MGRAQMKRSLTRLNHPNPNHAVFRARGWFLRMLWEPRASQTGPKWKTEHSKEGMTAAYRPPISPLFTSINRVMTLLHMQLSINLKAVRATYCLDSWSTLRDDMGLSCSNLWDPPIQSFLESIFHCAHPVLCSQRPWVWITGIIQIQANTWSCFAWHIPWHSKGMISMVWGGGKDSWGRLAIGKILLLNQFTTD
jgi:hypothetical protein